MGGNGRGRGRPKIEGLDLAVIEQLAGKLNQEQIADKLSICGRTLRRRIHDDPAFKSAYQRGKANAIDAVAESLFCRAARGDTTAAIFYLKTQAGWKETQRIETEQNVNVNVSDARQRVIRQIDRIADRIAVTNGADRIASTN